MAIFMEIVYHKLRVRELTPELFDSFRRFQQVEKCWRKIEGRWALQNIAFTEDWNAGDYQRLCGQLSRDVREGGTVWGAFSSGDLKGFASVEGRLIGSRGQYAVLAELHVSEECRRKGIGRGLFGLAAGSARERGAEKLYISAMSAEESQAFYREMGCVEAVEADPYHVQMEPCDVQMEYLL